MSEIVILGETLDFLVWHESPGSFYVREKGGNLQVIELVRALPAGAQTWIEELTIDPDPIRISDCLLLPPPCVAPEDIPEDWQLTWIKTHHGKRLMLDDSDHEPLERALASYKAEQQFSYRRQIEEARTIQDTEERKRVMALLREKYEAPLHWIGDPGQLGGFAQQRLGSSTFLPKWLRREQRLHLAGAPSGTSILSNGGRGKMASISMRWRARGANTTTGFGNTWASLASSTTWRRGISTMVRFPSPAPSLNIR
jgi:hypothetical protein